MIMMKKVLASLVVALAIASTATATNASDERSWEFSVFLDGSQIGHHSFELRDSGDSRQLRSVAEFDVRFLFFTAYRYRHANTEVWANGCLQEIDARTRANSERLTVSGEQVAGTFVVEGPGGSDEIDECVMTFAYWNPEFLQQPRLLNPQTGDYLDVEVERLGAETISVRGEDVYASVYRLTAKDTRLTLWYSADDEWLALESVVQDGRVIRYELT
jgi:hypothetical protein